MGFKSLNAPLGNPLLVKHLLFTANWRSLFCIFSIPITLGPGKDSCSLIIFLNFILFFWILT
jgi:hypothetical protein